MEQRKYLPTLGDLIDRLSIDQIKEVIIPENKDQYAMEIEDVVHDIDLLLTSDIKVDASLVRAIIVLAQINLHIWNNEADCRSNGGKNGNLALTHGLNGIRTEAKNRINTCEGTPTDKKIDCLAAEFEQWKISWIKESL